MLNVRVTALEQFRLFQEDDDLDVGWLLTRLLGKEPPSDAMLAGTAFHSALEQAQEGNLASLSFGNYLFDFNCDSEIQIPTLKELEIQKQYGDLLVTGHVDGLTGKEVVDYKTTAQFDADRYMSGYQWRYYLDILDAKRFRWEVFVISDFGPPFCYEVKQCHRLIQVAYPGIHEDCAQLAHDYYQFALTQPALMEKS